MTNKIPMIPLRNLLAPFDAGVSVNGTGRPAASGEIGVLKVSCVRDGLFFPQENKAVLDGERNRVAVSPKRGDILITRANTPDLIGACGLVDRNHPNLFLSDKIWLTRPLDAGVDDVDYIVGVLCSDVFREAIRVRATGTSAGMKNISKRSFLAITVPRPPRELQRRCGATLKLFAHSEACAACLVKSKRHLKRALLQQLLTGKGRTKARVVTLADVVRLRSGNTPSKARPDYWGGDFPWVSAKDLKRPRIGESIDKITSLAVKESATVVPPGTVVILVRGMTLLKDVPVALTTRALAINQDIKGLEPSADIDPGFLLCTLASKRRQLMGFVNLAGHGTGKLDTDRLLSLPLRLPPLVEQRSIAGAVEFLDHEIALLTRQLAAYRQLKRGLMQKLLTGEIDVLNGPDARMEQENDIVRDGQRGQLHT